MEKKWQYVWHEPYTVNGGLGGKLAKLVLSAETDVAVSTSKSCYVGHTRIEVNGETKRAVVRALRKLRDEGGYHMDDKPWRYGEW